MPVFLNTSFTFIISMLKSHLEKNATFMANLKEKYTDPLSQRRQADNSFSFNVSQNLTFKDNKALVLGWPKSSFGF